MGKYLRYTPEFLVLLFIVISISLISQSINAQGGGGGGGTRNDTNYTAYFDPEIEEEFDVKTHVVIIIDLYTLNMSKVDEILANLSSEEFLLGDKFVDGSGFWGNSTESGFDKLVHNLDVKAIYLDKLLYTAQNSIDNNTIGSKKITESDYSKLIKLIWILTIVICLIIFGSLYITKKRRK